MIWPFKKKNNRIKSTSKAMSEFNKLRASVGMEPMSDDDYCETIAWVFVYELLAQEVKDECNRLPVEDSSLFMMAYASYLKWLIMKGIESNNYPPDSWTLITPLIERELSKQPWHKPEVMNQLFNAMVNFSPLTQRSGKYFKVPVGPWGNVQLAVNIADYDLSSTSLEFDLYVTVTSTNILKSIAKMAPKG